MEEYFQEKGTRSDDDIDAVVVSVSSMAAALCNPKERKERSPKMYREQSWWTNGYGNWDESEFKKRLRIARETFEYILDNIHDDIEKQPTNLNPFPTTPDRQLAMTLYRLIHGCSFSTVGDLFRVSISLAAKTFNKIMRLLVVKMCDSYVTLPSSEQEWEAELRGFIENYEFPCVGAWDGFHVYISSKLKSFLVLRNDTLCPI